MFPGLELNGQHRGKLTTFTKNI